MAVEKEELPQLEKLYQRGLENEVKDLKILDSKEIKDVEPYCEVMGLKGLVFVCPQILFFVHLKNESKRRDKQECKGWGVSLRNEN